MYSGVDKFGGKVVGDKSSRNEGMDLEDSIALASIDETLVLNVDGAENIDNSNEKLISANINPETGQLMWVENEESSQVSKKEIYHRVVSKSQMASMLHDKHRNEAYFQAIKQAISSVKNIIKRDPVVLDIGAGTGLLSLMAASSGAAHVYACEMFEPLCEIAKEVIDNNGLSEKITVIPKRSIDVEVGVDIPSKVDLIVTEIFDTVLLGEGVLPTLKHARENLLNEKGKIVPSYARVFAQLVESPPLKDMIDIPNKRLTLDISFARSEDAVDCRNNGMPLPVHASKLNFRELSEPFVVLEFDFENLSPTDPLERSNEFFVDKLKPGTCHGVLMWWALQLSKDVILSTAPGTPWQDHWLQSVYPLAPEVTFDQKPVKLTVNHNDLMIWFEISKITKEEHVQKKSKVSVEVPNCFCGLHFLCNSERTWMMGDSQRNSKYFGVIQKYVSRIGDESICLDISDGSLCALMAAAAGASKIYSFESRDFSEMLFQQISDANNLEEKLTILGSSDILSPDMFEDGVKVELLMSEPFYYQMQNWQLTQAVSFWYRRNYFRTLGLLSETCRIVPLSASVKCVAIELKDLQTSFGKVGRVCGFDHSFFDDVVLEGWAEHDYVFPLWMYDFKEISKRSEIFRMDFTQPVTDINVNLSLPLKAGVCHAIAMWIDYSLDEETSLSCAPECGYWKTTLRFFPDPWEKVGESSIVNISAKLDCKEAKCKLNFELNK